MVVVRVVVFLQGFQNRSHHLNGQKRQSISIRVRHLIVLPYGDVYTVLVVYKLACAMRDSAIVAVVASADQIDSTDTIHTSSIHLINRSS